MGPYNKDVSVWGFRSSIPIYGRYHNTLEPVTLAEIAEGLAVASQATH